MIEQEFNIGDVVHFAPYGRTYQCQVVDVRHGNNFGWPEQGPILYELRGIGKDRVKTLTSGLCIIESRLFEESNEEVFYDE